jgi:PTS system nitrogen regulatory IIA component
MLSLKDYLDEGSVLFLDAPTRDDALRTLIAHLASTNTLSDPDTFYRAVLEREKLVSTGIGMGLAIPHAKLPSLSHFFLAVGIHRRGIEWESLDNSPVRLIFLIGGPDDKQSHYLQLLSTLTTYLRDPELRRKLMSATTPAEVVALLTS